MQQTSRSRSRRAIAALALALALIGGARRAAAQACCAGSGAVTPARLGLHEDALVGAQLKAGMQLGSHNADGAYIAAPTGARELNFEQDVFAALRVLPRGQLGLLVPFVQTYRDTADRSETGGGLGDVNFAARYDLVLARESSVVPGIGLLGGLTLPTGTPAESAHNVLATDATGIGAVQVNAGLAIEQAFGPWLLGVTAILAYRAPHTANDRRMELAPEIRALASAGYALAGGVTIAGVVSYAVEGDATVAGTTVPRSSRRATTVSLATAIPLSDQLRVVGSLSLNPPLSEFGVNQPVNLGLTLGMMGAFL
jgi:hypothetical protein